jgi:hypothetical protein
VASKPRKIGPQQLSLLVFMARSDDKLFPGELLWSKESPWSFGTHSDTIRLLESLERRGLVESHVEDRSYPAWELTDDGRYTVIAAHPERGDLYPELGL